MRRIRDAIGEGTKGDQTYLGKWGKFIDIYEQLCRVFKMMKGLCDKKIKKLYDPSPFYFPKLSFIDIFGEYLPW